MFFAVYSHVACHLFPLQFTLPKDLAEGVLNISTVLYIF